MSYVFQIVETEKQPVLSVRTTTSAGDLPNILGEAFAAIVNFIGESGEEPLGPAFVAYYNMDMENLSVEIGFPVAKEMEGQGEIENRYIPAGKKATGFHKGAYQELETLYEKLAQWISQKGYEPTGVVYEYYYNSPQEIPESELLTKVEFLLKY